TPEAVPDHDQPAAGVGVVRNALLAQHLQPLQHFGHLAMSDHVGGVLAVPEGQVVDSGGREGSAAPADVDADHRARRLADLATELDLHRAQLDERVAEMCDVVILDAVAVEAGVVLPTVDEYDHQIVVRAVGRLRRHTAEYGLHLAAIPQLPLVVQLDEAEGVARLARNVRLQDLDRVALAF